MKKIILTLLLITLMNLAWSQGSRGESKRPERPSREEIIKRATKELRLTDEQVAQWTEIHKKYESSLIDQSQVHKTKKVMGRELEATLTEEQLEKFKRMQKRQGPPRDRN